MSFYAADRFFIDDIAKQVATKLHERLRIDQEDVIRELCFELARILEEEERSKTTGRGRSA